MLARHHLVGRRPTGCRSTRSRGGALALVVAALALPAIGAAADHSPARAGSQHSPARAGSQHSPARAGGLGAARTAAGGAPALVGDAGAPGGRGYWALFADGTVRAVGAARSLGSATHIDSPAVAIVAAPRGTGYWVVTAVGGVRRFGAARWHGSLVGVHLDRPIVAAAATPDGGGYWLVGRTGAVHAFGDARRYSPRWGAPGARWIVAVTPTADGRGYWLTGRSGRVWAYGDARRRPSGARPHAVVGMAATRRGSGYWLASAGGNVWTYGTARFDGSAVARVGSARVVGINRTASGYWLLTTSGRVIAFDTPRLPSVTVPTATPALPAGREPARSITPPAAFDQACYGGGTAAACNRAALTAIDAARAAEGYGPLALPRNLATLSLPSQILAVANAERVSRHLPALPQDAALDVLATAGALTGVDPTGPGGYGWGSNIAWGYPTALAADFAWMYDDGPASPNLDCPRAGAPGCWGHRRNILAPWPGAAGAAALHGAHGWVLTELFVERY